MAPELEPHFTTSHFDDHPGITTSYNFGETATFRPWLQFLMTTPTLIASINSALVAAGTALLANRLTDSTALVVGLCAAVFLASWILHFVVQLQKVKNFRRTYVPRFPSNGSAL